MAKKVVLGMIIAALAAGSVFAQTEETTQEAPEKTWYNSYSEAVGQNKILINAGIGAGILPYTVSLPAISVSAEYVLQKLPLSIGGYFGITADEEKIGNYTYGDTMIGIGVRGSWHFNFMKALDAYASLSLGWLVWTFKTETPAVTAEADYSTVLFGFNLGARYFFTKNIGAYVEVGYSAVSVASVGLSLKF
ncbi:MAG: porin family protein [Spirochaetaceae bacterium]|jgi:opacity protein-like surface antigen|nr:porin family protein [Spirochaetaceae bacterium]